MPFARPAAVVSAGAVTAAFAAATTTWLLLLVAAPYLVSHAGPGSALFDAGGVVYLVGHMICHQGADRSFHAWGVQLPVCARCTGLYAGAVAGGLFVAWRRWARAGREVPPADPVRGATGVAETDRAEASSAPTTAGVRRWRRCLLVAALPTAASVALEISRIWAQSPLVRAVVAIPLGFTVSWFVAVHAADLMPSMRRRPYA